MASVNETPFTENVVIDFEFNRMQCTFFEEEWVIEKMVLMNLDETYFAIFLEKIAPTTIPFTVISSVSAACKLVEQMNYFDKTSTRCKIFACESSILQKDRLQYPNRRIHIELSPKEQQSQPDIISSSRNMFSASKDSSHESNIGHDEAGVRNLSYDIAHLLENCDLSDVTLTAGEKTVGAHKCILSARSEVFKAMFEHNMSEKQNNVVEIQDVDYEILEIFVRYLYTGMLPALTVNIASNLYIVADKYVVGDLKMKCATFLCSNLCNDNIVSVLSLADCFSDEMLKRKAFDFILKNRNFLKSDNFLLIKDKNPKLACEVYAFYIKNVKRVVHKMRIYSRQPPKLKKIKSVQALITDKPQLSLLD